MINGYEFLKYQPESYRQLSCKDLTLVYYDCPQTVRRVDVFSQYHIMTFVIRGKKIIHSRGKSWILEAGTCHFFKKGAFNQELYLDEDWRFTNLYIPDSYLRDLITEYYKYYKKNSPGFKHSEPIAELDINDATWEFRETLLGSFNENPAPQEAVLEQRCRNLIFSILTNPQNLFLVAYLHTLANAGRTSLFDVMETNYTYNLSLQEYAKIANRSLATFKREFKNLFHVTPAKWLLDKRLGHAQVMLITTRMNITEITFESGFENSSHFSRVFKDKYGIAPLRYRRQYLAQQV